MHCGYIEVLIFHFFLEAIDVLYLSDIMFNFVLMVGVVGNDNESPGARLLAVGLVRYKTANSHQPPSMQSMSLNLA